MRTLFLALSSHGDTSQKYNTDLLEIQLFRRVLDFASRRAARLSLCFVEVAADVENKAFGPHPIDNRLWPRSERALTHTCCSF